MTALVTGGTGFVGAHIVRALLADGQAVRCLVRAGSAWENLAGLDVEKCEGDLGDLGSLARALSDVRTLFHCAADYRLFALDPTELYRTNVLGTRQLLELAGRLGVERVVYTSSVGALAASADSAIANEDTPVDLHDMVGHYKRSKYLAARVVDHLAARGLPVVTVSPSTPVGALDRRPTPTGQIVVDFLNRRLPAYVDTGLNLVDVRDVARGHLQAAEQGTVGRNYILGCLNLSLREMLERLGRVTGLRPPRVRLPHVLPIALARFDTWQAQKRGLKPRVSLESALMAKKKMYFDSERAISELGFRQTPIDDALEQAATWYRQNGYVERGPLAQRVAR